MREQASALEALVESEISRIEQSDLVALARSLRIPVRREDRPWDYGAAGQMYPCWVAFEHAASNTAVVYCEEGFGPRCPWGLLWLTEPRNMGMDCQWFVSVEDALRNCPAWKGVNPADYEIQ